MTPCAIFDLDGTLLDSAPLFADIINAMRSARGSVTLVSQDEARRYASLGGISLVSALLGKLGADPESDVAEFRERYRNLPTPPGSLFPGVRHGLAKLHAQGVALAICSNKPQPLCEKVLEDLGLKSMFQAVVGARPGLALKPDPSSLELALRCLGATPREGCYIGDSELDYQAARAAAIPCVMVTYGYAAGGSDFAGAHLASDFDGAVSAIGDLLAAGRLERADL